MEGLAAVGGIGGVLIAVLGFFVNRLIRDVDTTKDRVRDAELKLAKLEALPGSMKEGFEAIHADMGELKELVKEMRDDLYRPKTGTSQSSMYAVRQPPSSPPPMPPRPRDPRRER